MEKALVRVAGPNGPREGNKGIEMNLRLIGGMGAAMLCTAAGASFTNYSREFITLPSGRLVVNFYAHFSHANDRVLNVYNLSLSGTLADDFYQSEANPFWKAGNTENKNTSDDSWVTIGTNPNGSGNAGGGGAVVVGDPNFVNFDDSNDSTDYSYIQGVGTGPGWYNGAPANSYGYAFDAGRVLLAHFVLPNGNGSLDWQGSLTVYLNGATSSTSGVGMQPFMILPVPAPAGVSLVGFAGLVMSRKARRRSS